MAGRSGDNQAINDYVLDLFYGGQVGPGGPVPPPDEISRAVLAACASAKSDASRFVGAVAADLHLSADELRGKVVAACARYRTRVARDKASGYQGNADLDPFIRGIAAQAGTGEAALRAAVDAICPT